MFNNDIESMLAVSKISMYDMSMRVRSHEVYDKLKAELDYFMWRANCRSFVLGRNIPIGLDLTISESTTNKGYGFFDSYIYISLNIPYVHIGTGYSASEEEKKIYREYSFSVFGYEMFLENSFHDVNEKLSEKLKEFSEVAKNGGAYIYRPIGFRTQQVGFHRPEPSLNGFISRYNYIGILLYEVIYIKRTSFLIYTEQVQDYGTKEKPLWKWDDGRIIGENLSEGINDFPEDEGLVFDGEVALMFKEGWNLCKVERKDL